MYKAFIRLNVYYKCVVLSGLFLCVISLALIPLYFIDLKEIPLGILLGAGYAMLAYFLTGLMEDKFKEHYIWALLISIFRYIVFAALLFFVGLWYYKLGLKIFNIFAVTGGYFICLIILIILFVNQGKKERKDSGSI